MPAPTRTALLPLALALVMGWAVSACSPVVHERGVTPAERRVAALEVGTSDRASVAERLGAPTARATFAPETWYYVYQRIEQFAFLPYKRKAQQVLVLQFDDQGRLAATEELSLADGRKIAHSDEKTPTQGARVSTLRQILGNIGRGQPGGGAGGPGGAP